MGDFCQMWISAAFYKKTEKGQREQELGEASSSKPQKGYIKKEHLLPLRRWKTKTRNVLLVSSQDNT